MDTDNYDSLLVIVFIVFLILKLTGVIDWSWWWVTSPLWIPLAIVLGIGFLAIMIYCLIISWVIILNCFRK